MTFCDPGVGQQIEPAGLSVPSLYGAQELKVVVAAEEDGAFPVWESGHNKKMHLATGTGQCTAHCAWQNKDRRVNSKTDLKTFFLVCVCVCVLDVFGRIRWQKDHKVHAASRF